MKTIQDLELSIDIVELVKRYTTLKKAGTNYKALCPFPWHTEKTPSFIISPSKQIAYCFGCHRWGGPLKFIMDAESCSFKDAVDILSSITWVQIKGYDAQEEKRKQTIYTLFREITAFYKNSLRASPAVYKYLVERGLDTEMIDLFEFGYASSGIDLYHTLKDKGFDDGMIEESQVFVDVKAKKDKFINRVIFPLKNPRGDIVGFAGRIMWAWEPKYLNSPASKIYDKSSILYGLYEGKSQIVAKNFVIVTEGYMDAITLQQAGYKNTVCVSGTALTEKHIQIIKKLTSRIYLCFDNDKAWENATRLAIEMLKNKDVEIRIIVLEWGKDPDEIIRSGGNFNDLLDRARTPIGYELERITEITSLQDKKALLKKLLEIVKSYHDSVERDTYLKEVAKKLDIKLEVVYLEYNKTRRAKAPEQDFERTPESKTTSEDLLIAYCINSPKYLGTIKELLIPLDKYYSFELKNALEKWKASLDDFSLELRNKYLALSTNHEALELQAQIESNIVQNDEKVLSNIQKTITKFNLDIAKQAEKILKERIKTWDLEAIKEYWNLVKFKK